MPDEFHALYPPPPRSRPEPWALWRARIRRRWTVPFVLSEWLSEWVAYALGRWTFLEVLDHASRFSILLALIFYLAETSDRRKQKHYQAWQVINTAQGKGGSGGRTEALQELNADGVPLVGVDASDAFLQGARLPSADLRRADFRGADLLGADLTGANLQDSRLRSANFRNATLRRVNLQGANLAGADLSEADLAGVSWEGVADIHAADLTGVKNAPKGFLEWAARNGATLRGAGGATTTNPAEPVTTQSTRGP